MKSNLAFNDVIYARRADSTGEMKVPRMCSLFSFVSSLASTRFCGIIVFSACFQSRSRDSISSFVGRSVGPSVGPSVAVHEARNLWRSALFFLSSLFFLFFHLYSLSLLSPIFSSFFLSPPCLQNGVGAYERHLLAGTLCRALLSPSFTMLVVFYM